MLLVKNRCHRDRVPVIFSVCRQDLHGAAAVGDSSLDLPVHAKEGGGVFLRDDPGAHKAFRDIAHSLGQTVKMHGLAGVCDFFVRDIIVKYDIARLRHSDPEAFFIHL